MDRMLVAGLVSHLMRERRVGKGYGWVSHHNWSHIDGIKNTEVNIISQAPTKTIRCHSSVGTEKVDLIKVANKGKKGDRSQGE